MLGLKEALFSPGKLLLQAWFEKTEKKKEKNSFLLLDYNCMVSSLRLQPPSVTKDVCKGSMI